MASKRTFFLVLPIATASLALAACGGGDDSGDGASDDRAQFREAALDYAECMRRNGVDMPDPAPDEGGIRLSTPPEGPDANFERAQRECEKHLEKARPPELSEEEEREFRERALEYARCMRKNGIDMPDPTFGEGGRVTMRLEGGNAGPDDPAFQEAQRECGTLRGPRDEGS
jgi:hypothetical protein